MAITLMVNGQSHTVDVDPTTPLLYVLSDDLALRGPKFGCGLGQCGCCTVIVRGPALSGPATGARGAASSVSPTAIRSCITPVQTMNGAEITTLEGLGTMEKPHALQKAFIDEQAMQCGFCLSGVMLTAKVALDRNPRATDAQLRQALSTVLCRCGAHTRMMKAIKRYQQEVRA
jgi:nicotinate dehydrogenase subunit A